MGEGEGENDAPASSQSCKSTPTLDRHSRVGGNPQGGCVVPVILASRQYSQGGRGRHARLDPEQSSDTTIPESLNIHINLQFITPYKRR